MPSKTLAFSFLMVLGCAKGVEIDPQEVVVILPILPASAADASVDGGAETLATTGEVSIPPPGVTPAPAVVQVPSASTDGEARDAASPALSDSGT